MTKTDFIIARCIAIALHTSHPQHKTTACEYIIEDAEHLAKCMEKKGYVFDPEPKKTP